jgi:TolB protein
MDKQRPDPRRPETDLTKREQAGSETTMINKSKSRVEDFILLPVMAVLWLILSALPASAQLEIEINKGSRQALPIAISNLEGNDISSQQIGADIGDVIRNNLRRSGLFVPINPQIFPQQPEEIGISPNLDSWRSTRAQALAAGKSTLTNDGRLRIEFRLWDVAEQTQIEGLAYSTVPSNWRRIAHIIADAIYERLIGEPGFFDSRIVYVAESGSATERVKRLAIMDQDGANQRYLTDGSHLVLTPRFSPTSQEITYLSYVQGVPRVFLYNLNTGQQETLGDFPGMTFAPRFSPDGNQVLMSLADEGNTDVYAMDLRSRRLQRLTENSAIDTSPSYAPDSRKIVFNSDRGGSQQLYVMNSDGSNVNRISFGKGLYATPVWSPNGQWIAFTRILESRFAIGIMRPDGSDERILTEAFLVEGPTWSPNGRMLAYFGQEPSSSTGQAGRTSLFMVDTFSFTEEVIPTPTDASDPAWSPKNP